MENFVEVQSLPLDTNEVLDGIKGTEYGYNSTILEPDESCRGSGISNFDEANLIIGPTTVENDQYDNLHTLDSEDIQLNSQSLVEMVRESEA